jgi:DNA polymerase III subunit delta
MPAPIAGNERGKMSAPKMREGDFVGAITKRPELRFFLAYGHDESAIAAIAQAMVKQLPSDAEGFDLDSGRMRADPAILLDEAASSSLFGGSRYIRLHFNREEGVDAVANLLDAQQAGNPVIATAGNLPKTSKLLKLVQGHPLALSYICYLPDEGEATDRVAMLAREAGLKMDHALAAQIARYTGNDRQLAAAEIEKLALYYDAAKDRPVQVQAEALSALAAETAEDDIGAMINLVMGGDVKGLGREIASARALGLDGIRIIRSLQRRLATLASLRSKVDHGAQPGSVVRGARGIFWKEQDAYVRQLGRWTSERLAGLNSHLLAIEARLMANNAELGGVILEQELTRIARAAARAR